MSRTVARRAASCRSVTRLAAAGFVGLATTLLTALLTAAPAYATDPVGPSEGADPGAALGPAATLLLYVGIPVGACLVIATLVLLPGAVRAHRYRPAEGWSADPVWFAGPVDPTSAVAAAQPGDVTRGGARGSW